MAAAPERQVGDDLAGRGGERLEHLVDEDRHVRARGRAPLGAHVRRELGEARGVALLVPLVEAPRMAAAIARAAAVRLRRRSLGCG